MKSKKLHQCKHCKLNDASRELAEKCTGWCREHGNTCNTDIAKFAVQ